MNELSSLVFCIKNVVRQSSPLRFDVLGMMGEMKFWTGSLVEHDSLEH